MSDDEFKSPSDMIQLFSTGRLGLMVSLYLTVSCNAHYILQVETAPGNQFRTVCQIWGKQWTLQFESFAHARWSGLSVHFDSRHAAELKFADGDLYHMNMVSFQFIDFC